jgi:exo-beta-1,3-glucanase (GH17 family)
VRIVAFLGIVVVALVACGSGGGPPEPFVRRELAADVLARPAVAYSGYRVAQSPDTQTFPSEEQIEEDLRLLVRGGYRWIRLFDAGTHAERVLRVIDRTDLDLVVLLGVWIAGNAAQHDAVNRADMERAVALATQYPGTVVAVSVGNETLDDWSNVRVSPSELIEYMQWVRDRVTVPVTTDDSWFPFTFGRDGETSYEDVALVAAASDFLSLHVYAYADAPYGSWNWKQEAVPEDTRARAMMDAALAYSRVSVRQVRNALAARDLPAMPIVIGEIGWKSAPPAADASVAEPFLAHEVNQKMFHDRLMAWLADAGDADRPAAAFWFEGFDEPWKAEWGDDGWGLLDVDRRPKFVARERFPDLVPTGAPAYTEDDAVYWR